jgi:hypothetical protein
MPSFNTETKSAANHQENIKTYILHIFILHFSTITAEGYSDPGLTNPTHFVDEWRCNVRSICNNLISRPIINTELQSFL